MTKLANIFIDALIRNHTDGTQELHLLYSPGQHKGMPEYLNLEDIELCIYWQIDGQAKLPDYEVRRHCYRFIVEFSKELLTIRGGSRMVTTKRRFKIPRGTS